jgi:hypothetical protein
MGSFYRLDRTGRSRHVPAAEVESGLLEVAKVMRDRRQNKDGQKGSLSTALLSGYESLVQHVENGFFWWQLVGAGIRAFCSPPSPRPSAIGIIPIIMANDSVGRTLLIPANTLLFRKGELGGRCRQGRRKG